MKIETAEQARQFFLCLKTGPNEMPAEGETAENWICCAENCREASIDICGDVWIGDPQTGQWLSDDALIDLANAIDSGL